MAEKRIIRDSGAMTRNAPYLIAGACGHVSLRQFRAVACYLFP